ncbi:hypothetical protein D9Q98_003595 [Chlorella vulgaris]|uniref:RAP domain-containing protein n=1 Tax=Chlorella vulgaris TaxID=3077 RepID=A0A9D4YZK7_CHLVU|nr:hypothetical protein D9Q98_003595 [Chlorella vulgaris]
MFVPTAIAPTAAAVSSLQLDAMASSPAAIGALGDVAPTAGDLSCICVSHNGSTDRTDVRSAGHAAAGPLTGMPFQQCYATAHGRPQSAAPVCCLADLCWQRSERDPAIEYSRRIKEESSITGVALLVQSAESEGALNQINLAAALDRTVKLDKQANSRERGGVAAWAVLRPLSMTLLQELDAWALVALLRAASHFGSFSADELKAWQAALKSQQLEVLPEVAASNTLLSLHTLIAGSEALKAAIDASLVVRLVQRWLQLVPGMLSIDACQGLYGAVCLGYPFSQQELNRITQQALKVDGRFTAANGAQLFRAWSLLDAAWREWDIGRQQSAVAASSKRQPQAVFPGNAAVEEVLWRVLSLDMNARDASQILLALGHLRFRPPAAAAAALVDVYVRCLEKQQYTNNDLNAFLDGCALLGRRLSPAAVESCLEAVGAACSSNPPNAPRYISTAAWALAHLQQYDIEAWQQLAGLAAAAPIADWSAVNLCRLYQSYMHVRAEHGQAVQLPVQLLTAASAAALAQETSRQSTTRAFHSQVARELEAACPGEAVEVGQQVGPGGRSREAALKGWEEGWLQVNLAVPSLRLVVQTDGRYQYFHNDPEVPLPTTLARDRLLRSWGWHVISVPFTIPEPHRAEYLKQRVPSQ